MKKVWLVLGIFVIVFGTFAYFGERFIPQMPEIYRNEDEPTEKERQKAIEEEQKAMDISFNIKIIEFEKKLETVEQLYSSANKDSVNFNSEFFNIFYRSPTDNIKKTNLSNVYIDFKKEDPLANDELMTDFHIVMEAILTVIDNSTTYDFSKIEPLFAVEPTGDNSQVDITYSEHIKINSLINGKDFQGRQFMSINIGPNTNDD